LAPAATSADEIAIKKIIDANIYGTVFEGHDAFKQRHADTFGTFFKGSTRVEKIRRIRFVTPKVAIVDTTCQACRIVGPSAN